MSTGNRNCHFEWWSTIQLKPVNSYGTFRNTFLLLTDNPYTYQLLNYPYNINKQNWSVYLPNNEKKNSYVLITMLVYIDSSVIK